MNIFSMISIYFYICFFSPAGWWNKRVRDEQNQHKYGHSKPTVYCGKKIMGFWYRSGCELQFATASPFDEKQNGDMFWDIHKNDIWDCLGVSEHGLYPPEKKGHFKVRNISTIDVEVGVCQTSKHQNIKPKGSSMKGGMPTLKHTLWAHWNVLFQLER